MRPLLLELTGFLGYLEETIIDLTELHSASITGRVGAGKSSLPDAMVYALYGVTRSPTKDGVIHTSATSLKVVMEFELGEATYRITRTQRRSGGSKAYLDWFNPETGQWESAGDGDGRVGATEEAIRKIFPVSLAAFRATSFIEQGKADTITQAKPSARGEIFSDILGLDEYAARHEQASAELNEVSKRIVALDEALEQESTYQQQYEVLSVELAAVTGEHESAAQSHKAALTARNVADQEVTKAETALQEAISKNQAASAALKESQDAVDTSQSAFYQAGSALEAHRGQVGQQRNALGYAQQQVADRKNHLEGALRELQAQVENSADLSEQQQRFESVCQQTQEQLRNLNQVLTQGQQQVQQIVQQVGSLDAEQQQVREAWKQESARRKKLQEAQAHAQGADCYACGQSLDPVLVARMVGDLSARMEQLTAQGKGLEARKEQLGAEKGELLAEQQRLSGELTAAQGSLNEANIGLSQVSSRLQAQQQIQANIATVQRELEALSTGEHPLVGTVSQLVQQMQELEQELDGKEQIQETAASELTAAQAAHKTLEDQVSLINLEPLQQTLQQHRTTRADASRQCEETSSAVSALSSRKAVLEHQLKTAQAELDALESVRAERRSLVRDRTILEHAKKALSPSGAPQMIMNTAITALNIELEAYLNELSEGTLNASLSTTRQTKAGTTKNEITLLVTGADGHERPYETFSGGQKFLVDFALHMAIAKMLFDRRGAIIDTLVVDEGWNSLEGEEKTSVLRTVQNLGERYSLVLAITHDDDVVNAMPQRIHVQMVSGTSQVEIQP